jgi:K+-transporting ATPase KdpF subunit
MPTNASRSEDRAMIWLTVVIAVFLFVYLLVALLRPEWF